MECSSDMPKLKQLVVACRPSAAVRAQCTTAKAQPITTRPWTTCRMGSNHAEQLYKPAARKAVTHFVSACDDDDDFLPEL